MKTVKAKKGGKHICFAGMAEGARKVRHAKPVTTQKRMVRQTLMTEAISATKKNGTQQMLRTKVEQIGPLSLCLEVATKGERKFAEQKPKLPSANFKQDARRCGETSKGTFWNRVSRDIGEHAK